MAPAEEVKALDQQLEHARTGARFAPDATQSDGAGLRQTLTEDTAEKGTLSGSSGYASSELGVTMKEEKVRIEKRLVRKLDVLILPCALLLYLSAYLDRGNLGSAKLLGMVEDILDDSDSKYSFALTAFFITYITLSTPATLFTKAVSPSLSISCGALIWSVAAACQAAATNPAGLYVCRLFVGVGEAMFGQSMALHLSMWYTKGELAKRVGLFISGGSLAGAFGGLIAYGVAKIDQPKIEPWRVLFLIDGCPSVLLAIFIFFCLPSRPDTSKYLSEDERTVQLTRLNRDASLDTRGLGIDWAAVRHAALDWRTYVMAVMYSAMNLGLGSTSGFLPTIVKNLGYSAAKAQLMTVPPYAVALVFMLCLTTWSDRVQSRGIPVMSVFCIGIVGWTLLHSYEPVAHPTAAGLHVRYFACICVVTAGYSAIPLIIAWTSAGCGGESAKAYSLGMLNTIGQCLSVLASYSFPKTEAPQYFRGTVLNMSFQCLGLSIALGMTLYYRWENARRDRVEGKPDTLAARVDFSQGRYDKSTGFRYVV